MRVISRSEQRVVSGGLVGGAAGFFVGGIISGVTQMMQNGIQGKDVFDGVGQAALEGGVFGAIPLANSGQIVKAIWTFNLMLGTRMAFATFNVINQHNGTVMVSDINALDADGNVIGTQKVDGSFGPPSSSSGGGSSSIGHLEIGGTSGMGWFDGGLMPGLGGGGGWHVKELIDLET